MTPAQHNQVPWKNTLLSKQKEEELQNPQIYFGKIVTDSDTFSTIYEDILAKRAKGEYLEYFDPATEKIQTLQAFMIVQDSRGVNWICPVRVDENQIDQFVRPLVFINDKDDDPVMSNESFGTLVITLDDYISACSRGFENASRLLRGNESVKLRTGVHVLAVFYLFKKAR